MKRIVGFGIVIVLILSSLLLVIKAKKDKVMLKQIDELKVRMTSSMQIPDPTFIQTTGDWYYLDHISRGLVSYDSNRQKFSQFFAESWSSNPDGLHLFKLRPDIKFHDGSSITPKDILWSIKRLLIKKTSTHFPLWDYVQGCESLKSLEDECSGLFVTSEGDIAIRLKTQTDSFFLQLASPETGIWWSGDMNPQTGELKPSKFSGPYFVSQVDANEALLMKNKYSTMSEEFPSSPKVIRIKRIPLAETDQALASAQVDLVIRSHRPFADQPQDRSVRTHLTPRSTILHFFGTGKTANRAAIGQDLIQSIWQIKEGENLVSAETFLPFAKNYGLERKEFLAELPEKSDKNIKVVAPRGFLTANFKNRILEAAKKVGVQLDLEEIDPAVWINLSSDEKASEKYDYILSSYAASERYPAVQLRYLTGSLVSPPIDLKLAENAELTTERVQILRDYEKWLLRSRQAIPFLFNSTSFLYREGLDLGEQPATDAEIELWRVQSRVNL